MAIIHVLILLGGIQGVIIGLIHVVRVTALPWSRFLGWALAIHALSDVFLWLYWTKSQLNWQLLMLLPLNVVLLPIYFLFRYIRAFTGNEYPGRLYGLVLGGLACLEVIIYLVPAGAALYIQAIDQSILSFAKSIRNLLTISSFPVSVGSCVLLHTMIRRYQMRGGGELAGHRGRVGWLYLILTGVCVVYGLALLPLLVQLAGVKPSRVHFYPLGLGSGLFLAGIGVRAFIIHERLQTGNVPDQTSSLPLPPAQVNLYEQAIQLIQAEKLYKQPDLKLADVAGRLSISPHYLSRIMNQQAKKNFNDLVNEYRIGDVTRMMHDPAYSHYTLEGLGREAGFGAKSTYQASFKRLTGLTPSQYRASHRPLS